MKWLQGKKTYIVSALMVIVSLVQLITGEMTLSGFILSDHMEILMEGAGLSTLRAGLAKRIQ